MHALSGPDGSHRLIQAKNIKQPPEGPSTKGITLIRVGFFTTEAAIKSKRSRREELIPMENTCFWQRSLTAKQLFHEVKRRKTANTHPESAFGWVFIGWALGRSLKYPEDVNAEDSIYCQIMSGDFCRPEGKPPKVWTFCIFAVFQILFLCARRCGVILAALTPN